MLLLPYRMETIFTRLPIANIVIVVFISIVTYFAWWGFIPRAEVEAMVLQDWDIGQIIGNTLLHGNFFHWLGNMLFLWIFGNAICAAIGSIAYPFAYLFLAIMASTTHLLFDAWPALGASGAIYGVVGMTFMLFPVNKLRCFYNIFFFFGGRFTIKTFWMIAFWIVFDNVLGVISGEGYIAYWAHIGGFVTGMVIAAFLLMFNVVESYDPTFVDIITGRKMERETHTLDDLNQIVAEKERKAAREQAELANQQLLLQNSKPDPMLAGFEFKEEATPILRILNCVQKGSDLICYFVNDGDVVRDVVVESSEPSGVLIHPIDVLGKRTPGWLQIQNANCASIKDLKLTISYDIGTGFRLTKSFVFQEAEKKFMAV